MSEHSKPGSTVEFPPSPEAMPLSLKAQIAADCLARDFTKARASIAAIDRELTGVAQRTQMDNAAIATEIREFFSAIEKKKPKVAMIYLGDSGMSRLLLQFNGKAITLEMAFVTPKEVKAKFEALGV